MAAAIGSANAAALRVRLAPWHDDLKAFWAPWSDRNKDFHLLEGEECMLLLRVRSRRGEPLAIPNDLRRTGEALRLLELLARVDFDAWVREMFTIWPEQLHRWWVEFKLKPAARVRPIRIGLLLLTTSAANVDRCMKFVTHNEANVSPSEQYAQSRRELLQDGGDKNPPSDDDCWQVPICLEHDYSMRSGRNFETEMLQSTVAVVKAMVREEDTKRGAGDAVAVVRSRFVVREVRSAWSTQGFVTSESLRLLLELAKLGVCVGNLPSLLLFCPRWDEHAMMKEKVEALRYLTAQDDDDTRRMSSSLRSIRVSFRNSREDMIALLSAAERSKFVKEVEIDLYEEQDSDEEEEVDEDDEGDRGGDWEWITYHLFSRFASHKIDTLQMNLLNLRATEVDAVRDLLADKNPLARLDGRPDESNDEQPQILASRFCVLFPAGVQGRIYESETVDHKSDKFMYTTPAPVTVRVISKPVEGEGPWWLVVLAGLGFAWVHEEDILTFVPWSSADDALTQPEFPTVIISDLASDSKAPAVDLLSLIGQGTSRLELRAYANYEHMDEWCGSVLRVCPKLEELHILSGAMEDLSVFVAAAEAGHCRLRHLNIQYNEAAEPKYVHKLFKTLGDPLHPLTTQLQQLDVNFIMEGDRNLTEIVESAVQMLKQNRHLQYVRLGFHCIEDVATHKLTIDQAFASQLEADVPIRLAPLCLSSKLAFLSVVDRQLVTGDALSRLDSGVVAGIFQFAAVARTRLLQVSVPTLP